MVAVADRREPILALGNELAAIQEIGAMLAAGNAGREGGPMLIGPFGSKTPLPEALYEVLAQAASDLAMGHGVVILPYGARLTTQQAADMLNVSRPTLVHLLEDGALPFTRVRSHRRILLADLLAFQRQHRERAEAARLRMVARSQELGVYDDFTPVPTRSHSEDGRPAQ